LHLVVIAPEIVGVEEEEYAPAGLVADGKFLGGRIGFGEEQVGTG